jgi:hypothetical protein
MIINDHFLNFKMEALKIQNDYSNGWFEISRSLEMGALEFQDDL